MRIIRELTLDKQRSDPEHTGDKTARSKDQRKVNHRADEVFADDNMNIAKHFQSENDCR